MSHNFSILWKENVLFFLFYSLITAAEVIFYFILIWFWTKLLLNGVK